jgi:hypothetical protein
MKWTRLIINLRLSCAVCAPSTPKKLKNVNLSKRIFPASKFRHPRRSRLRLAWPHLPYDRGPRCRWRPQTRLLHIPALRLRPMLRPINLRSLGPPLPLGLLRSPAALPLAPLLLGQILPPPSTAAVLRRCSDPNPQMRRKTALTNTNVGSPLLPPLI